MEFPPYSMWVIQFVYGRVVRERKLRGDPALVGCLVKLTPESLPALMRMRLDEAIYEASEPADANGDFPSTAPPGLYRLAYLKGSGWKSVPGRDFYFVGGWPET